MIRLSRASRHFSLGAPHRPIAFSFHKSLLFLVNFFQDDTWGVARNNLVFSALSIFRVEGSVTLKMLNLFIVNQ